jgi:hypothetical protein
MSNGIYRPLYVLVEIIEAEVKRLLAPAQALARGVSARDMSAIEKGLRFAFMDNSIHLELDRHDTNVIVGHKCRVCPEFHLTRVKEMSGADKIFMENLVKSTKELLETPCNIELRTP